MKLVKALLVWAASAVAVPLALGAAFRALFEAWNVNADTAARAPGWARLLYRWHGSLITLISAGLLIVLCAALFGVKAGRPGRRGWLMGIVLAFAMAALFLLTDSLRPAWPLTAPRLSFALVPLCLLTLLAALAEEMLTKAVLYEIVRERWGRPWALVAAALALFLINGGLTGTVISGVNTALTALLCGLLYERRGLWTPVLFRWGWAFATVFLLGQGGGDLSVYRLYAVSETLLTGGDQGFAYGVMWTMVLVGMIAFNMKRETIFSEE